MRRLRYLLPIMTALSLSGCATILGLVTGPFTGAYELGSETKGLCTQFDEGTGATVGWTTLYGTYGLVMGPFLGVYKGFLADSGFVSEGHYNGSDEYPSFGDTFHPFSFNLIHD